MKKIIITAALAAVATNLALAQTTKNVEVTIDGVSGFQDTPMQPDGKWHVHDPARPQPPIVTPGQRSAKSRAAERRHRFV